MAGRPAEAFEFPWMVILFDVHFVYTETIYNKSEFSLPKAALGYLNRNKSVQFDCGGTIISENFILTAAHCVKSRRLPIMVRVGNVSAAMFFFC